MRRLAIMLAPALIAAALAACGSSGSSTTSSTAGTSAAQAVTSAGASDSTPIDSPQYRKLIAIAASERGLAPQTAAKIAECVVRKETAQGYKTIADLGKSTATRQQAVQDAVECTTQALPAG
jgi:hypothetical protein